MLKNQTVNANAFQFILVKTSSPTSEPYASVSLKPQLMKDDHHESITPRFNHDGKYFTPAFILPIDEKFYRGNICFQKIKFEERVQNANQKTILQSNYKFYPPSQFCQICRAEYHNYLEHINSQQHIATLVKNPINNYIKEIACNFSMKNKIKKMIYKVPKINRSHMEHIYGDSAFTALQKKIKNNIKTQHSCTKNTSHSTNVVSPTN